MSIIVAMREADLAGVDLNLLKLLHALIEERSVTRAGVRLGLSQPAASRALARLRRLLADRIVVRTSTGLDLTPRAEALTGAVARILEDMRSIIAPASFDPSTATGRFTIAAADRLTALVAPNLVAMFAREAPLLDLEFPQPLGDNIDLVANGTADLALGIFDDLPAGFYKRKLYEEPFVCIVRSGHPTLADAMTPERFVALPHVTVLITGIGDAPVDLALARVGLKRRVAVRVPHFLAAAMIVAESDLILSLPRGLARKLEASLPIRVIELPVPVPPVAPTMIWHERRQDDPAHRWLREQVVVATAHLIG